MGMTTIIPCDVVGFQQFLSWPMKFFGNLLRSKIYCATIINNQISYLALALYACLEYFSLCPFVFILPIWSEKSAYNKCRITLFSKPACFLSSHVDLDVRTWKHNAFLKDGLTWCVDRVFTTVQVKTNLKLEFGSTLNREKTYGWSDLVEPLCWLAQADAMLILAEYRSLSAA